MIDHDKSKIISTEKVGNDFDSNINTTIKKKLKSISELNTLANELVVSIANDEDEKSLFSDISVYYLTKSQESYNDFKKLIDEYLVQKNERIYQNQQNDEDQVDFESIYMFYTVSKMIIEQLLPTSVDNFEIFKNENKLYKHLVECLSDDKIYFQEIMDHIELKNKNDKLLSRFQKLKGPLSFSSATPNNNIHNNDSKAGFYTHLPSPKSSSSSTSSASSLLPTFNNNNANAISIPRSGSPVARSFNNSSRSLPTANNFIGSKSPPLPPQQQQHQQQPAFLHANTTRLSLSPTSQSLFPIVKNNFPSERRNGGDSSSFSTLLPKELNDLVSMNPKSMLCIDYRSKAAFDEKHIYFSNSTQLLHIDPATVSQSFSCLDIENLSMATSSEHEITLFKNRNLFELIVIYDWNSETVTENNYKTGIFNLFDILINKNSGKPLQKDPVLLKGGLKAWIATYGVGGIASNIGVIAKSGMVEVLDKSRSVSPSRVVSTNGNSVSDKVKAAAQNSQIYNKSYTDFLNSSWKNGSHSVLVPSSSSSKFSNNDWNSDKDMIAQSTIKKNSPVLISNNFNNQSQPQQGYSFSAKPTDSITNKNIQSVQEFEERNLEIITGISNLGNTCYMNCILQCLIGSKSLVKFFLLDNYEKHINFDNKLGSKGVIAKAFYEVVYSMYLKSTTETRGVKYIIPKQFKHVVGSVNPNFKSLEQQDCSEFLNYILDALHEDLNENGNHERLPELGKNEEEAREKMSIRLASTIEWERYLENNFSSIVDLFQGQYLSRLQCTVCNSTSTTYNSFSTLSLPIPRAKVSEGISLEKCFDEFCSSEILKGDDKWFCPHCNKKQETIKTLRISRLPKNLIIVLKRFKLGNYISKLNSFVHYTQFLSLTKYWPSVESERDKKLLEKLPKRGQNPPFDYKLYGVVNHFGNLINGHYTAYVDKGTRVNKSGMVNGWCYFDDTKVYKNCDFQEKVVNVNAYVLFYTRV
ncbi:hypothetical protein PACTADRAFT_48811 [Pachysolen tannophilus NRRL Y-2460]|uniref:Ubiquitin carboxyl-terminal hydrolase n=1 Tax=Pachysolen tannophilus NRRL Y-2460 TaxID=669874 RepID=A0A1E4TZ66_PACTA|nr:hypothetical protein PACTADRAFT_48811 [Pachysolen tannophilus NRRL Y-2460]